MRPTLGKRAFVPSGLLDPKTVREAKSALRFSQVSADRISHILAAYEPEDGEDFDYEQHHYQVVGDTVTVNEYRECRGGVSLPRAWAKQKWPNLQWRDSTKFRTHDIKFPGRITARDTKQANFFEGLLTAAEQPGPQEILAVATTGSGKTVAGIYLGWQLSTPTLIVVDSNKIAGGWLKNFRQFFGQGWTERNVGRVQQDKCEFRGKAFSIAMAQSIARRRYPQAFYEHFGLVVVDEIQVFGGPHFSPILYMFPARVRVAVTAEEKTGPFGRLIRTHVGKPRVVSQQEVLKPHAYLAKNEVPTFYCYNDGALLTNLSRNRERNERLANVIKNRGYERGRQVLAMSNRTRQLLEIKNMLVENGVPESEVGIHAGRYETNRYVLYYKLEGSEKRNRLGVFETRARAYGVIRRIERGDYAGITMPEALYNRLQLKPGDEKYIEITFETSREQYSPSQFELDNITHSCSIILATYEIFSKGVDVPKLDMGVELLPVGNLKQPLGRILRLKEGKATPEWYALHDFCDEPEGFPDEKAKILNKYFTDKTATRIAALKKAGAKIKWA